MAVRKLFFKKKAEKEVEIDISKHLKKIISKNYKFLEELGKF